MLGAEPRDCRVDGALPEVRGATRLRYGEQTLIFGKSACPICSGPITRFEIAGRRAFRCDVCQPTGTADTAEEQAVTV